MTKNTVLMCSDLLSLYSRNSNFPKQPPPLLPPVTAHQFDPFANDALSKVWQGNTTPFSDPLFAVSSSSRLLNSTYNTFYYLRSSNTILNKENTNKKRRINTEEPESTSEACLPNQTRSLPDQAPMTLQSHVVTDEGRGLEDTGTHSEDTGEEAKDSNSEYLVPAIVQVQSTPTEVENILELIINSIIEDTSSQETPTRKLPGQQAETTTSLPGRNNKNNNPTSKNDQAKQDPRPST